MKLKELKEAELSIEDVNTKNLDGVLKLLKKNNGGDNGPILSEIFDNWDYVKNSYEGTVTQYVKDDKPKGSPIPKKWFDKADIISIYDNNVWYYLIDNVTVSYIPKTLPDGSVAKIVSFPDEVLHSDKDIAKFSIGKSTGDRKLDKAKALQTLEEGYDRIPNGYILHHDIESGMMQIEKKMFMKHSATMGDITIINDKRKIF